MPRYEEELLYPPPDSIVLEKDEGGCGACFNALDHRFIGRIDHTRSKGAESALELEGLFAVRTPEVHDLRARGRWFKEIRRTGRTIEVSASPPFGDDPRDLSRACVGSPETGIKSQVHGAGCARPDLELAVIQRQHASIVVRPLNWDGSACGWRDSTSVDAKPAGTDIPMSLQVGNSNILRAKQLRTTHHDCRQASLPGMAEVDFCRELGLWDPI